eukprot:jgi/Mesen1/5197/ME000258S04289
MRRSTLAVLSPSQINQAANGPSRQHLQDAKKRLTLGTGPLGQSHHGDGSDRLSAGQARAPIPRRSSMYNKTPQIVSDPRPLSDKGYQQTCIRTLITYLTQHGYDHAISPKLLTTPTSKEFTHIVQFLFKKMDPNIKFAGKIEDDVPLLFKRLSYPFQISKSALYAVGSPHTWPGLLAALTWLVELLVYEEAAEQVKEAGVSFDDNGQKLFFDYVGKAYQHFMEGDDENCELLQKQLERTFQERDAEIAAEVDRLEQANATLQVQLEKFQSQPSPLAALESKKSDYLSDIGKFQKLIVNLQQHRQALEKKLEERKQDQAAKVAELAASAADNEELRRRIQAQEINLADVERMTKEKAKTKEILRSVTGQREALEKQVWDHEVQLAKKQEELESTVRQYHTTGDRLKVIPVTAKRAGGVVYEIELNARAKSPEDMVGRDLKGIVKPALGRLKEGTAQKMRAAQQELLQSEESRAAVEEALAETQERKRGLEEHLRKAEAHLRTEREKLDAEVRHLAAEVEGVEAATAQLRLDSGTSAMAWEEKHQAAVSELEEKQRWCADRSEELNQELMVALDLLISHKAHIEQTLNSLHGTFNAAARGLQEAPLLELPLLSRSTTATGS